MLVFEFASPKFVIFKVALPSFFVSSIITFFTSVFDASLFLFKVSSLNGLVFSSSILWFSESVSIFRAFPVIISIFLDFHESLISCLIFENFVANPCAQISVVAFACC